MEAGEAGEAGGGRKEESVGMYAWIAFSVFPFNFRLVRIRKVSVTLGKQMRNISTDGMAESYSFINLYILHIQAQK